MIRLKTASLLFGAAMMLASCSGREPVSRDELPQIRESIIALENAIELQSTDDIDSLLSGEAAGEKTTPQSVLAFIYNDSTSAFTGFGNKQIVFRADAARVDCTVTAADSSNRPVTLTLKKEDGVWLLKKIEANTVRAFPIDPDSTALGDDTAR